MGFGPSLSQRISVVAGFASTEQDRLTVVETLATTVAGDVTMGESEI